MKHINSLPDLCLRHIFSRLSLSDLLLIGHVCRRWETLQKSVTCKRFSMTLLFGDDAESLIKISKMSIPHMEKVYPSARETPFYGDIVEKCDSKWSQLEYDWLDSHSAIELVETFPNISTLQISVNELPIWISTGERSMRACVNFIDQLIILLKAWSSKLCTLNLFINFKSKNVPQFLQEHFRLFHLLNQMNSLRHLSISLYTIFYYRDNDQISFYLPVISQLEQFYFECHEWMESIVPSLKRFGENNSNLKQVGLGNIYTTGQDIFQLIGNQQLAKQITRLPALYFSSFDFEGMQHFCDRFSSLQALTIDTESLRLISQMANCMRSLEQLIQLSIIFSSRELEEGEDVIQEQIMQHNPVPQLKSVKLLTLFPTVQTHADLYSLDWPALFPNVEIVHYRNQFSICSICHNNEANEPHNNNDGQWKLKCLKLALKPWKLCPKLKMIYAELDQFEGNQCLQLTHFDDL